MSELKEFLSLVKLFFMTCSEGWEDYTSPLRQSDDLLLNKDKNKDELYFFKNQNNQTIKED